MSKLYKNILWLIIAIVSMVGTVVLIAYLDMPRSLPLLEEVEKPSEIDMGQIKNHLKVFCSPPTRISGSPGADAAFDYILTELEGFPVLSTEIQEFPVAVPVNEKTELVAQMPDGSKKTVQLYALWPNLGRTCQTPPEGICGPLVDIGSGSEEDMQGRRITDSIVLIDWDSNTEWLSVPEFGGSAIIFRGSRPSVGNMARRKFLSVAADIPRYYVAKEDVSKIEELRGLPVTVNCLSSWKQVTSKSIFSKLCDGNPTGDPRDQTPIIFHAYYDSISVVPDLAPGAEQGCGAAVLLELSRHFVEHPAPRPVYALFTGGHGQALAGMTHFIKELRKSKKIEPGLFVGLDISSRSESFGVFSLGHFRDQYAHLILHKFSTLGAKLNAFASSCRGPSHTNTTLVPPFLNGIGPPNGRGWWTFYPYRAPFESEIPTLAGIPGITLTTVNDARNYVDTPDDVYERLNFDMLGRQLTGKTDERAGLVRIARAITRWKGSFVSVPLKDVWSSISGRAVWLDQQRNYTPNEPLAHATVFLKTGHGDKYLLGTRGIPVSITDSNGHYTFDGLIRTTDSGRNMNCVMEVYGTADESFMNASPRAVSEYLDVIHGEGTTNISVVKDGSILYAIDMARAQDFPWQVEADKEVQHVNIATFPCRTLTLTGLTDPRGYLPLTDLQLLQASTKSQPFQFGKSSTDISRGDPTEAIATVWADPTLRIMLTLGMGFQGKRLVLINNTPENPAGSGFVIEEIKSLPSMVLQGVHDMWNLNESRINKLERNGVSNPRIRKLHSNAAKLVSTAQSAFISNDYKTYRIAAERGWSLEGKAYSEIIDLINNMLHGVLFYLALLLPLSYCLERLLIASVTLKKRIIWMAGIFSFCFIALAIIHPAFRFTMSPLLVLLAFTILSLVVTVSVLIISKMDSVLLEQKRATTGRHEEQYRRAGVLIRAFDLGISNIRRRPQRGFLTGLSVVMVMFILLSFTSLVPVVSISRLTHPRGEPVYEGLLARDKSWNPLPDALYESLKRSFVTQTNPTNAASDNKSLIAARGWFFSDWSGRLSQIDLTGVSKSNELPKAVPVSSLLCFEHTEPEFTGVTNALLAGRWFSSPNERGIILSEHIANQLGYDTNDIGRSILLFGENLPLTGILDTDTFDELTDLDGEPLTPVNFVMQQQRMAQMTVNDEFEQADTLQEYIHYSVDKTAILPFSYGKQIGAATRSVAVKAGNEIDAASEAEGYARRSNLTILACTGDNVILYAALNTSQVSAAWQIIIPVVLAFIMILGTMLGSVYERRNEIFIYNSVGLSPTNVSSLFIAESAVYAIVGAGVGYLLGQGVAKGLQASGLLAGLTLNYTAGTAIFVTITTMGMVLASAIYPAHQAFRAAIPDDDSEKEKDKQDAEDSLDSVEMYLPFVATKGHVLAIQAYLDEYLESIQGVTVGQLAVDNLCARVEWDGEHIVPILEFRVWMSPFDLGVSHDAQLKIVYRKDHGVYQYHLSAHHFSGDRQNWRRLMPRFLKAMRQQLLMWRILSEEDHSRYAEKGKEMFDTYKENRKTDTN